jgi:hypothetical protein
MLITTGCENCAEEEKRTKDTVCANFICHTQRNRKYFGTNIGGSKPTNFTKCPLLKESQFPWGKVNRGIL